jgi:hypothetical protein
MRTDWCVPPCSFIGLTASHMHGRLLTCDIMLVA